MNHVNATASEAKMALQMLTNDEKKKAQNWEKYVVQHVKYHIVVGNLMEYGYQKLDPRSKVRYLLNSIRCEKLSTAVTAVMAHPDKYEKDFNAVVAFLTQYIDKRASTPSVKVAPVAQNTPAKWQKTSSNHGTFRAKIELKKYSREEYNLMSTAQHQQLYKLWKKARLVKDKKTPESSRGLGATVAAFEAKTDNTSDESLFPGEKPKASNRNNSALDRKGYGTRQIHADT